MALRGASSATAAAVWVLACLGVASGKDWCMPNQACWPKAAAWAALNSSVGGRLFVPQPAEFNLIQAAQTAKSKNSTSTAMEDAYRDIQTDVWRAQQPGSMQYWSMQANVSGDFSDFCILPGVWGPGGCDPRKTLPSYYVEARTPADVAATLAFVNATKIRLVIKSSGHEVQGRSHASPDSLLLWMFHYHDDKAPIIYASFTACSDDMPVPAATTFAGTPWSVLYPAVETAGYHLMGGDCRSVCSAGGFALAGGHGFAAPANGLAVDNILRFDVMLANGTQAQASTCMNPDLFWALKGAGGHMAVILSVTYKLYPRKPITKLGLTIAFAGEIGRRDFLSYMLYWNGRVLNSSVAVGGTFTVTQASLTMLLLFNDTGAAVNASITDLQSWVGGRSEHYQVTDVDYNIYPSYIAEKMAAQRTYGTQVAGFFTSRLWPIHATFDPIIKANSAYWATEIVNNFGFIVIDIVGGPGVWMADPDNSKTSVHPSWRKAIWHVHGAVPLATNFSRTTAADELRSARSRADFLNMFFQLYSYHMPKYFPSDMGAYFGESSVTEQQWQEMFWGRVNYCRLAQIKMQVDPDEIFWCRHCVGDNSNGTYLCPGDGNNTNGTNGTNGTQGASGQGSNGQGSNGGRSSRHLTFASWLLVMVAAMLAH